jgi:hypothetical protein
MKKTGIQVNAIRKIMSISVTGRMGQDDAKVFLEQYNASTNSINAKDYTLEIDCTEMQLLTKDMYDELAHVMGLYKSTGFKHVEFAFKSSNQILKMQLGRLAKGAGLTNISFKEVA